MGFKVAYNCNNKVFCLEDIAIYILNLFVHFRITRYLKLGITRCSAKQFTPLKVICMQKQKKTIVQNLTHIFSGTRIFTSQRKEARTKEQKRTRRFANIYITNIN